MVEIGENLRNLLMLVSGLIAFVSLIYLMVKYL